MLHSWTRRLKLESELRVGISISRSKMCAVAVSGHEAHPKIIRTQYSTIESPLFVHDVDGRGARSLHKSMQTLIEGITPEACPIHVAIPDLAVRSTTFELDALPKSRSTLTSLACWRMAKEFGGSEDEFECQINVLGVEQKKHLVYVQAGDRYWLDQIRSALKLRNAMPWIINSASFFRYNSLNDKGIAHSSAMLSIDDDCWTLLGWDTNNRIRLSLTRMRSGNRCVDEAAAISKELTRVMRAWQVTSPEIKINSLYLDGCRSGVAMLTELVESEIFAEIRPIDSTSTKVNDEVSDESSLKSLAIMAAQTA